MSAEGFKIMLVDDHAVVREGYRALLQKQRGLTVVAEAADGAESYRLYKSARPDLVIMDLSMSGIGGIEAIKRIRQWDSDARILVFTMHLSAVHARQAIRAGARGYVTKSSPPEVLLAAVSDILQGRIAFSPDIDHELAQDWAQEWANGGASPFDRLTSREFEILRLLLMGKSTEQVAETLHVSPKTVANSRYQIRDKLGVHSDIELVRLALRQGLLDGDEPS
jgi:two-component system, NarL family, invasion response regulator UvrY